MEDDRESEGGGQCWVYCKSRAEVPECIRSRTPFKLAPTIQTLHLSGYYDGLIDYVWVIVHYERKNDCQPIEN